MCNHLPLLLPDKALSPVDVSSDGVRQVAMDCTEVDEGYKVRYTPLSPGHYYVGIKYDGYHIAGSPFKVDVDGKWCRRVRVRGEGRSNGAW